MSIIVAIDGPGGVGKSSVSFAIAKKFNFMLIDTGAMYRSTALFALKNNFLFDSSEILELAGSLEFSFKQVGDKNLVFVNNQDVSDLIRTQDVSKHASDVAKNGELRKILVRKQRELAVKNSVVIEGRDIGTVVFPNAEVKLFLTASSEIRAKRRYAELIEKGVEVSFEKVLEELKDRDYNDSHRKESPLIQAEDAILVDTGYLTINEVIDEIVNIVYKKIEV
jgi:cytidylate kinase